VQVLGNGMDKEEGSKVWEGSYMLGMGRRGYKIEEW
jgi:hypothetical protein